VFGPGWQLKSPTKPTPPTSVQPTPAQNINVQVCLLFKLGHTISKWPVLQLKMCVRKGYNETGIQLHNSFFCGRGRIAQPLSSLSSISVVFYPGVHNLKQASGHLKSGICIAISPEFIKDVCCMKNS
jgi:hypothetical protein